MVSGSTEPIADEIYFIWPDLKWTGGKTMCDGFWGMNLQAPFEPSELQSTVAVGPDLKEIHPHIKAPPDYIPTPFWHRYLEYISSLFASLPLDKIGDDFIAVGLTIRSTATPVLEGDQHIETTYQITYEDTLYDESSSSLEFYFSDLPKGADVLSEHRFSLSGKADPFEFADAGPPTNVIGTLVFVGRDGSEVGSMPVSLAVPSD